MGGGELLGRTELEEDDEDEVTGGELEGEELGEVIGAELEGEELDGGTGLLDVAELLTENGLEIGAVITGDAGGEEDALEITLPEEEAGGDELIATEELPIPEETTLDEDTDAPGVPEVRELDPTDTGLEELVTKELLAIDELGVETGRVLEPELLLLGILLGAMPPTIARMNSPTNWPVAAGLETGLDGTFVDGTMVDGTDMAELLDPRLIVGDELLEGTELGKELTPDGVEDAAPELDKELTPDGVTDAGPNEEAGVDPDATGLDWALLPDRLPGVVETLTDAVLAPDVVTEMVLAVVDAGALSDGHLRCRDDCKQGNGVDRALAFAKTETTTTLVPSRGTLFRGDERKIPDDTTTVAGALVGTSISEPLGRAVDGASGRTIACSVALRLHNERSSGPLTGDRIDDLKVHDQSFARLDFEDFLECHGLGAEYRD
ncbi:hypothetical protein CGGC5_v008192 [Colletotrichum fructicola Nara gc5]|uniref:Uncharacterized protein n=1 Tax=Colletotrichum fructicola (strain Nara gc5) TaxID=1213859 RepID=A0A7J6J670_COLFN|nr:hypothetical protein CGGC5_v008192 [Colletotrichum fructicola Nara gc5]